MHIYLRTLSFPTSMQKNRGFNYQRFAFELYNMQALIAFQHERCVGLQQGELRVSFKKTAESFMVHINGSGHSVKKDGDKLR